MKAIIVTVGRELLMGKTVNSNLATIARELFKKGIDVARNYVIDDNLKAYYKVLDQCDKDIVIFTGGLGPTVDDLSKEAVFSYFNKEVYVDEDTLRIIQGYFDRMNIEMTDSNIKQAHNCVGGTILENPNGTAPGVYFKENNQHIVLLPGPPHEMLPMLKKSLEYILTDIDKEMHSIGYKLVGTGESTMEEGMKEFYTMDERVTVAPYASIGEIKYIFSSFDEAALKTVSDRFEKKYKQYIYGLLDDDLEGVVVKLLNKHKKTISFAESCTGGLLASRIVNVSGASNVLNESLVTYSNQAKMKYLNVSKETLDNFGAVSEECAREMVIGLCEQTGANIGVSVTGIAGPTGGTKEKPVGLVYFGLMIDGKVTINHRTFSGSRYVVRYRATQYALNMVRKGLME